MRVCMCVCMLTCVRVRVSVRVRVRVLTGHLGKTDMVARIERVCQCVENRPNAVCVCACVRACVCVYAWA